MEGFSEYEWDERKRLANIAKHRLDFQDVDLVFGDTHLALPARVVGEELRHLAIGRVGETAVAVIYTIRGRALRIISMRKAREDERRLLHQALQR